MKPLIPKILTWAFTSLLCIAPSTHAQSLTHDEVEALLNEKLSAEHELETKLDAWESGKISATQFKIFLREKIEAGKKNAKLDLISLEENKRSILSRQGIDVSNPEELEFTEEEVAEILPKAPTFTEFDKLYGIQIARTIDLINPYQQFMTAKQYAKALPAKRKNPALFGFSRDFKGSSDTWQARGVVARPFFINSEQNSDFLWTVVPAIEFDRVSAPIDDLRARGNITGEFYGGPLNYQRLNLGLVYGTDFDFDGSAWQIDFDYGFRLADGIQGRYNKFGLLRYRPAMKLHGEYATDLDPSKGFAESSFLRIGPAATLDLIPNFEDGPEWLAALDARLHANLLYSYFPSASSGIDDYELFRASLNWNLDRKGHLKLTGQYENGFLPLNNTRVETLYIGLGIAF